MALTKDALWEQCDDLVCRVVGITHNIVLKPEGKADRIARYKLLAWAPDQEEELLVQQIARTFMRLEPMCIATLACASEPDMHYVPPK